MKKKYYMGIIFIFIFSIFTCVSFRKDKSSTLKEIVYNGNNLLISIDGETSSTLPTSGNYYLVDYDCKNKYTKLSWDSSEYKLNVTNGTKGKGVACNLVFKSNPKLYEMPVGSYVAYEGKGGTVGSTSVACQIDGPATSTSLAATAETESPNSCLGQNAREDIDTNGNTYGYCYSEDDKYYTTGWRIAYIDSNNKPVIVSAGSPECNVRSSITGNKTYIKNANTKAMKYCNSDYVDGNCTCLDSDSDGYCDCTDSDEDGLCDEIENNTVDAWAISDIDFYNITKAISGIGKRLTDYSSSLGDSGGTLTTLYCNSKYSYEECGYNNDLIDIGGYYWFAARYSSSSSGSVNWAPGNQIVNGSTASIKSAFGLRPVISLQSTVVVTGGAGTMDYPYTIGNNDFSINDGDKYINSSGDKSNVVLSFVALSSVTKMCINVNSSSCSNYVDFADTYTLDWSNEEDGEKIVYVYYKNVSGEIVTSMNRSIIIDTVAPSNNSVSFVNGDGLNRSLTISSTGADYMCISNISSNVSDCTDWVDYTTSYDWYLKEGTGNKTIYVFFKDLAGNVNGPYSASTTCTNDCEYKYFIDAYSNNYIYLMRNDGATAMVKTTDTNVTWYSEGSQKMNVCGADNYYNSGSSSRFWCIGSDNNTYYKTGYNVDTWTKVNTSLYIDTSTYTYSIYPYGNSYAYIVRSDGKTNRLSSSGIERTNWDYGYSRDMAVCSGYSSSRVICLGEDGYYYYRTSYSSTDDYLGGTNIGLSNKNYTNLWIDMNSSSYTWIILSDENYIYNKRFSYNAASSSSNAGSSSIPEGGVRTCAGGGSSNYIYCLGEDGYLYYRLYNDLTLTKSAVVYK